MKRRAYYPHSISASLIVITLQGIITFQYVADKTQIQYNQLDVKYRQHQYQDQSAQIQYNYGHLIILYNLRRKRKISGRVNSTST